MTMYRVRREETILVAVCQVPQRHTLLFAYLGIHCCHSSFSYTLTDHNSISKNFDTIMTVQKPLKSSLAEFTHEQPLSSDQSEALKIHNQGSWTSLLLCSLTKIAFFSFSSGGS